MLQRMCAGFGMVGLAGMLAAALLLTPARIVVRQEDRGR
jgi:hypothetical protein